MRPRRPAELDPGRPAGRGPGTRLLEPGSAAPDFFLADGPSTWLGLADAAGRWLVVAFYVADWDPVSVSQLTALDRVAPSLARAGVDVVAISVDTVWSHQAFAAAIGTTIPLLADSDPPGAVAHAFGASPGDGGRGGRTLILVDPGGVVRWTTSVDARVDPGTHDLLSAIEHHLGRAIAADPPGMTGDPGSIGPIACPVASEGR